MSGLQSASYDPGQRILGRESQAVDRVRDRASGEGRSQSGVPYLAERGILPCCVGLSSCPILPHIICLKPSEVDRLEAGYAKPGRGRCVLRTQKLVPFTYNLRIPTCDCILFQVSAGQPKFFGSSGKPVPTG